MPRYIKKGVRRNPVINLPVYKNPNLSCAVVIPCHNYGEYLKECIDSVLNQSRKPAEILVILDACTDNSAEIAASYGNLIQTVTTTLYDIYLVRRLGYKLTVSDTIIFLDADDYISRNYIEEGIKCFNNPKVGAVTGNVQIFGVMDGQWSPKQHNIEEQCPASSASFLLRNMINSTKCLDDLSLVMSPGEDWKTWKIVNKKGWAINKAENITHFHRKHNSNITLHDMYKNEIWAQKHRSLVALKKKIRVGFVTPSVGTGGVRVVTDNQIKFAKDLEWNKYYITQPCNDDRCFNMEQSELIDVLDESDILYIWGIQANLVKEIKEMKDIPIICGVHNVTPEAIRSYSDIAEHVDAFWCVSKQALLSIPNGYRDKAHLIPLGIDLSNIEQRKREAIRKELGLGEELVAGFIGRLSREKNPVILAKAISKIYGAKLLCCTPDYMNNSNGFYREINDILGNNVIWTHSNDLPDPDVYKALDCLVVSSELESGPLVLLEALYYKCPVVSINTGIIKDLNPYLNNSINVLPSSFNENTIVKHIREVVNTPKPILDMYREHIISNYSAHKMTMQFEQLVERVVNAHVH